MLNSNTSVVCRSCEIGDNTVELPLTKPSNQYLRTTIPLFATKQGGELLGVYVIGLNSYNITIETISGVQATIERIDDSKITVTFEGVNNVWCNGIYICPKDFLSN